MEEEKRTKPRKDLRVPILLLLAQEILGEIGGGNNTGPRHTERTDGHGISGSGKGTQNARNAQKGDLLNSGESVEGLGTQMAQMDTDYC